MDEAEHQIMQDAYKLVQEMRLLEPYFFVFFLYQVQYVNAHAELAKLLIKNRLFLYIVILGFVS